MYKRSAAIGLILVLVGALAGACSSQPNQTATPFATQTESVQVFVVTATTQPTMEATQNLEPTITPLATFTPIPGLNSPVAPKTAVRPAATPAIQETAPVQTLVPATNPPPTLPPATVPSLYTFPAPVVIGPQAGTLQKNGQAIPLQFESIGPLPANTCYLVFVEFANPNANMAARGTWLKFSCGDQSKAGSKLTITLTRFPADPYTYATIRDQAIALSPAEPQIMPLRWSVAIALENGARVSPAASGPDLQFQNY